MTTLTEAALRRRRARRWAFIAFAPIAAMGLVLVIGLVAMILFAHQTVQAHIRDDAPAAIAASERQAEVNWFERWKAPYNAGTALAMGDRLPESRARLDEALEHATGLDVCPVQINLALVLERMGNAATGSDAADLFGEALDLALNAPDECRSDEAREASPDPSRDPAQILDDLIERLTQRDPAPPEPEPEEGGEDDEMPDQDALEELEERLERGEGEREQLRDFDDQGGGQGSGVERPW
ncbi:hypothetical protein [Microbacterium amylolyticum]|uniref:Tetratricopeptide repeat-containing protein n=1 Tax=Microbacterium amylolyticum TaxID=936337 RepID=A0ABS4ZI04_9MICO|nr:hypothetical protein [Microbacterium amylolyticum]MBP2436916.1 hypothetical protein [Microbacterium amylolyticum]